jgi:ribose transport system permease protein
VFGFVNGAGTAWLRIQPFVMTLAMMTIARGITREVSSNTSVGTTLIDAEGNVTPPSQSFQQLATPGSNLFAGVNLPIVGDGGIYFPVLALIIVAIVFQLILSKTRFGRHIYAVGGNTTAARLSGVNVTLVIVAVYTISGLLAGLAGPINAAYNASADPQAGLGYELDAIAAVVIGGASLAGGRGSVIGTVVGALILTLLDNVLGLNNVSANYQMIIKGVIVVAAVVLQRPDLFTGLAERFRQAAARRST